jgi:hypothetical protein
MTPRHSAALPTSCAIALLAGLGWAGAAVADDEPKGPAKSADATLDVRLSDGSVLKLALPGVQIEFLTPHGKLAIPVADIRKVELGLRVPDDVAAAVRSAVADLGSPQAAKREAAATVLLRHREKSYPALKEAAKAADAELAKRAQDLIDRLEKVVPDGRLDLPAHDVVHTEHSAIAGKVLSQSIRRRSVALGEVTLDLAHVRGLTAEGFQEKPEVAAGPALPDPGTLTQYRQPQHVGQKLTFRVTGAVGGSIWGTETYTLDSSLAAAAVHMGVLKVGETGSVTVRCSAPCPGSSARPATG